MVDEKHPTPTDALKLIREKLQANLRLAHNHANGIYQLTPEDLERHGGYELVNDCIGHAREILRLIESCFAALPALEAGQMGVDGRKPIETAPKGVPVIVAGGIAMQKTGGEWFTGMEKPLYQRPLQWQPKWWMPIPTDNDAPAPTPDREKMVEVWPDNVVADRHEVTGKWVVWYMNDEQAAACRAALAVIERRKGA